MSDKKKKYNVNLPRTDFPMKASLVTREPERLKHWGQAKLGRQLKAAAAQRTESFTLHDGPPYANGHIHMGHALNKTLKDIIVKFRTLQGKSVTYVPGWDCHGLPIEQALLKEMGKTKDQVDQLEFRKEARKYASRFVKTQMKEFERLGIFGEWDNPYLTMSKMYQASIARAFYELYEKDYIYRGEKPIYWCPECETALAEAELEYQDKTSKAVFVAFPVSPELRSRAIEDCGISKEADLSLLVWTTTPWTLPANVGAAVHPEITYGVYECGNDEWVILAKDLAGPLKEKLCGIHLNENCNAEFSGRELIEAVPKYRHPFIDRVGKTITADYVTATDGTGIVHIAPGHGEEDYVHGHLKNGLEIVSPVDHKGQFIDNAGEIAVKGMNIFDANKPISEALEAKGLLKGTEEHQHSYPFCWRSKTPVIVRSTPQWFLKIDHETLRDRLKDTIQDTGKTQWIPDWGKNRILGMIDVRPDWCLSRQRLWGVPIPVARHKVTGEVYVSESFKQRVLEVFEKESADAWFHYPKEHFLGEGPEVADLELETDILDVWFDSGVSHQAVLEYGHKLGFPADLYLEGSDQHRGWFQTSLITAVALTGKAPFRQVLTHGFVVDGQGKKMSKSLGNVVSPQEVLKQYGADILRLWVSSCDTDNDIRLSPEILERMADAYRKMRNTFRYMLGSLADFDPARHRVPFERMEAIDRWALSRLHSVAGEVLRGYEGYRFHRIYQLIYEFCITDLSSFYLDVLKDRLYCDHPDFGSRRSAQSAIYVLTKALCQLLSPILVFTADEVWQSFDFGPEPSVHLSVLDSALWRDFDASCVQQWSVIRALRRQVDLLVEQQREAEGFRSALECRVTLSTEDADLFQWLQENHAALETGLLVSQVELRQEASESGVVDLDWTENSEKPGRVSVVLARAGGHKCARCWRCFEEVGTLADPLLCRRCYDVESEVALTHDA